MTPPIPKILPRKHLFPVISVVIPAFNPRKYLAETLESIGRQTHPAHEVLVVDDASPEVFEDIIRDFQKRPGYPLLKLLTQPHNKGQAAARNAGIDASSGEFIAFLDSDDVWHPEHLERSLKNLNDTGATLSFSPSMMFRDGRMDRPLHVIQPMFPGEIEMKPFALLSRCFIIQSSVVVRAEAMKISGRFDESSDIRAAEDIDSFMRLLKSGATFSCLDTPTLYYRKHPDSATGRVGYIARQSCRVIERHIDWVPATRRQKTKLLAKTNWRTAFQLRRAGAPDHGVYLKKAIRLSLTHPFFLAKRLWNYSFGIARCSDAGSH